MIAVAALLPALLAPTPMLRAADVTGGRVVLCRPATAPLVLAYTHSMFGGEVRETFVAADGGLRRVEMTTANAAAAEYYAYNRDVEEIGGRFRVVAPDVEFGEIVVRVDAVGDHRLIADETAVDLLKEAGDGHRVKLDAPDVPRLVAWLAGGC